MPKSRLDTLAEMLAWMRKNGVHHARMAEFELTIDPRFTIQQDSDEPQDPPKKFTPAPVPPDLFDDPDLYGDGVVPTLPEESRKRDVVS